jgi:hypothetical protein
MRHAASPPTAPVNADTYLVVDNFGTLGMVYRETDIHLSNEKIVIADMLSGQFNSPERVVAFNTVDGWTRDVSEDIARQNANSVWESDLSKSALEFVERQLGENWASTYAIKTAGARLKVQSD